MWGKKHDIIGNNRSKSDILRTTLNGRGEERATHSSACVRMEEIVRLDSSTTIICHMRGEENINSLHKWQTLDNVRGMCQSPVRLQVRNISMSSSGGKDENGGTLSLAVEMMMALMMDCCMQSRRLAIKW